jgi:hypothetical protein
VSNWVGGDETKDCCADDCGALVPAEDGSGAVPLSVVGSGSAVGMALPAPLGTRSGLWLVSCCGTCGVSSASGIGEDSWGAPEASAAIGVRATMGAAEDSWACFFV